jgi:putative acetyltransferase
MIRHEVDSDVSGVRRVHLAAFPGDGEAGLVDALRENGHLPVSIVAEEDVGIVGHIAFSPVTVDGLDVAAVGLAPVAVMPEFQKQGIGSELIRAGLQACREAGFRIVVVLGEPDFYQRFGFQPAHLAGLENEYQARDEFMVLELEPGNLSGVSGLVQYSEEFSSL